jgi:hypothetical protein
MDCEAQDTGLMVLHLKKVKPPGCLTADNIMCIQVVPNLIMGSAKLHSGAVMVL